MGDYENQLRAQDFPSQVAVIRNHLDELPTMSTDALEAHDPGAAERLRVLLDHVVILNAMTTPQIVPIDRPVQLTSSLTEVNNSLDFLDEPANATSYVSQVVSATSSLSAQLWSWQSSGFGDDWRDAVKNAATMYRQSLGQQLISFHKDVAEIQESVSAFKGDLETLSLASVKHTQLLEQGLSTLDTESVDRLRLLDEKSTDELAGLEAKIETLQTQVASSVTRQENAIQQYQEQFSAAQERRGSEFTALLQESKELAAELRAALVSDSSSEITALKNQVAKSKELVSVFSAGGTANAFGKEAKEQGEAANRWRLIAVGLAVVGAILAVVVFLSTGDENLSTSGVITRLVGAVALAGAAGYAATQSATHRRREVGNRRAELLLVSFDPFVKDLPVDRQNAAREALLTNLTVDTGKTATGDRSKDEPVLSAGDLNLFKQIIDMIMRR